MNTIKVIFEIDGIFDSITKLDQYYFQLNTLLKNLKTIQKKFDANKINISFITDSNDISFLKEALRGVEKVFEYDRTIEVSKSIFGDYSLHYSNSIPKREYVNQTHTQKITSLTKERNIDLVLYFTNLTTNNESLLISSQLNKTPIQNVNFYLGSLSCFINNNSVWIDKNNIDGVNLGLNYFINNAKIVNKDEEESIDYAIVLKRKATRANVN